ncbi:fatty acid desaturase 2-like protein FADS2P1 [Pteropus vampyrus]|uniref:Fatty acid desaturase 2-like protein FADS2P1 n=1 Tax=Pteropus vampyrus TaxID=132908 RepID=A0A6P3RPC1_PTEVA|nr:fatty acid desaturase 2-like protein FADS2P1 [Pteropus vampyrus]
MKFEEKHVGNGRRIGKSQPYLEEKHQANGKSGANGKAEVSIKQEANEKCDVPRKSFKTYSWQEIQRHDYCCTDQWLVISCKVYDVTDWARRNTGGHQVLNHYAREDPRDVFRAMHPNLDMVRLDLKPLLIRELASGELSQKRNKNMNWWNYRHFQHHVKLNVYGKDSTIDWGPLFVLGDLQPVKHFFLQDIAWVSSFYICYIVTFGPFYGVFGTLLLMYFVKCSESPWIIYITQMSHIPMKMSEGENRDWFSTQVLTTCNTEQSLFKDWFTGHLNFQIKQHLFPIMPSHDYHKVAPLVRSLCAKHGLQYVKKPCCRCLEILSGL